VDCLWARADGRAEVHIHAEIMTEGGSKIALAAGGVAVPEESSSVFRLREHVRLTSNHPEFLWVNPVEIWAFGDVRLLQRTSPRPGIRSLTPNVARSLIGQLPRAQVRKGST
jgi:hypothetical protein